MNMQDQAVVEDRMRTAVIAMRESDSVWSLRREMRRARIHHVPIVDDAQHVIGIVSSRDLDESLAPDARAGAVMSRQVVTARTTDPAARASMIMHENGFRSLPVVGDDEQLVGIVTDRDLRDLAA